MIIRCWSGQDIRGGGSLATAGSDHILGNRYTTATKRNKTNTTTQQRPRPVHPQQTTPPPPFWDRRVITLPGKDESAARSAASSSLMAWGQPPDWRFGLCTGTCGFWQSVDGRNQSPPEYHACRKKILEGQREPYSADVMDCPRVVDGLVVRNSTTGIKPHTNVEDNAV